MIGELAYHFVDIFSLYPISPSTKMTETVQKLHGQNKKNSFNRLPQIIEMQSELGSISVIHGALQSGLLASTFTSSQGLLLMISTLHKLKGELLPGVIHVASRSITSRSLSISSDHQDIYNVRQIGVLIINSPSIQAAADLVPVVYKIAIESNVPIIHFIDGYITSHEIQKIEMYHENQLDQFIDELKVQKFSQSGFRNKNPKIVGITDSEEVNFLSLEAQSFHYQKALSVIENSFKLVENLTNRKYDFFNYFGSNTVTSLIIIMGSATEVIEETIKYLKIENEVGLINVIVYRPFNINNLLSKIPKSIKRICVLDRTKEEGSSGEPLFLDVVNATKELNLELIINGRYGIASTPFEPKHAKAVIDNLISIKPKANFFVGIKDDFTNNSLIVDDNFIIENEELKIIWWGLSGDGSVSGSGLFGEFLATKFNDVQIYNKFDARKANSTTRSYIRLSKDKIKKPYQFKKADLLIIANDQFLLKYDYSQSIKENGILLINTAFDQNKIETIIPNSFKKKLSDKKIKLLIIDGNQIAKDQLLLNKYNLVLISSLLPYLNQFEKEFDFTKDFFINFIEQKLKSKFNHEIINRNIQIINQSFNKAIEVSIASWKVKLQLGPNKWKNPDIFFTDFVEKINQFETDSINLSQFIENNELSLVAKGSMPFNTTFNNKAEVNKEYPVWLPDKCTKCGICSFVCPHATIRAVALTDEEKNKIDDKDFKYLKIDETDLFYSIEVDKQNCTGCNICVEECPFKALEMVQVTDNNKIDNKLTNYLYKEIDYQDKSQLFKKYQKDSIEGLQFVYPYFEASTACAGCGETPYYRLLTQLFGKNMIIANSVGCSSIYGATFPHNPFATDKNNLGPSWGNSLFENNAEYGYGIKVAQDGKINQITELIKNDLELFDKESPILNQMGLAYLNDLTLRKDDEFINSFIEELNEFKDKSKNVQRILDMEEFLKPKDIWIVGGDGWAYDIDFGGIDHIVAKKPNLNILILDNEVYGNTGGQLSKASILGVQDKNSNEIKLTNKKNLLLQLLDYNDVFLGQIAMGADNQQTIDVLKAANDFDGPSVIVAYSPCIEHKIKAGIQKQIKQQGLAVKSGVWNLWHYNPDLNKQKKNPFVIDYENYDFSKIKTYYQSEQRYQNLEFKNEEKFNQLIQTIEHEAKIRFAKLKMYHKYYQSILKGDYSFKLEDKNEVIDQDFLNHLNEIKKMIAEVFEVTIDKIEFPNENQLPIEISICISSTCIEFGTKDLRSKIRDYLYQHKLEDKIIINGTPCMGWCASAPNLKINGKLFNLDEI